MSLPVDELNALRARLVEQDARIAMQEKILQLTRNPIIRTGPDRRISWVNAAFESLTGWTASEVIGRSPGAVLQCPDTDPNEVRRIRRALDRAEPVRGTLLNQSKSGRRYWIEFDIQPLFNASGGLEGFQAVETEVTRLVEAERVAARALIESRAQESLLNSMAEAANVGGWEVDLSTMQPIWSRQTRRIHEVDDDFEPTMQNALEFYPPEVRDYVRDTLMHSIETGARWDFDLPFVTAKGRRIWVRAIGRPVMEDGRAVRLIGAFMDVTAEKAEAERLAHAERLNRITNEVQSTFLQGDVGAAFSLAMDALLALTGSAQGFIAEARQDEDGAHWLRTRASSDLSWCGDVVRVGDHYEIRNLNGLFGLALPAGEPVIVERAHGAESFLGAPIFVLKEAVGIVGLLDRPGGYTPELVASIQPVLDALGRVIQALRDREQRRRSSEALAAALNRADRALADLSAYQAALDQHAIVAVTDAKGNILFVNDRFCEISGYTRQELVGQNHRILNSGVHDRAFFVEMWRTIGRGDSWHGEICNRTKLGKPYWVDTTIVPMLGPDGRPERFVAVRYDITQRKIADAQLQELLNQLRGFFDVSLDLLCVGSLDGRFLRVNNAFEEVLGYPLSVLEGASFLDLVHPADLDATLESLSRLDSGAKVLNFVNRYRCADGSYRHFEWRSVPANGVVYAAARDITDRLAREAELRLARDRAEAATRAKSAFLANMSHEIRTPLNGVVGLVGALGATKLDPRQREMVNLIAGSADTLQHLLSDILDMSKIEAGRLSLHVEQFNLREAVETAAQVMRVRADDKGVGFRIEYVEDARGLFLGDALRVRQIVSNLTSNAVKFTDRGEVVIEVRVEGDGEGPALVEIAVRDTGIGFDEETASRLFTRFEQADGSTTRTFGGTGLGLAICKSLCALMDGTIEATSKPGEGSRFVVRLPLRRSMSLAAYDRDAERALSAPDEVGAVVEQASLRILLAEDHPTNQRVISLILEPHGVELVIAANGREALEAFEPGAFDLVLMDMQMPVMDGLAATRAIREAEARTDRLRTPIIMLSANAMQEHVEMALAAGADLHVPKPVTPAALLEGIVRALATPVSAPAPAEEAELRRVG